MSTVDQHDHLPVEQLAEYAEGLIADPPALATVDAHLAGCGHCQQVLRDLRDVTALLQSEPVEPMPSVVAIRLEAVLAAEAHERRMDQVGVEHRGSLLAASAAGRTAEPTVTATAGAGPEPGVTVAAGEPLPAGRPRSLSDARQRRARAVSALAAAATVAAFAIGAAILAQNMSGVDEDGGAVAGREQAQDNAVHGYAGPTPATDGVYRAASGQDFTAYTLSATARDLLAQRAFNEELADPGQPAAPTSQGVEAAAPPASASRLNSDRADGVSTLLSPAGLAACVAQIVPDPADVQVLAIDVGTYGGAPAALLILSDPTDPDMAQVRVVGASCGQGQAEEFLRTEISRGPTPAPTRS